jgi:hypothetical protein
MNPKHEAKAHEAELTDNALDEVVGGGVLLGDPKALAEEAGQLVQHSIDLVNSAGATLATAAVGYMAASAAAVEDRIEHVLGLGQGKTGHVRGF